MTRLFVPSGMDTSRSAPSILSSSSRAARRNRSNGSLLLIAMLLSRLCSRPYRPRQLFLYVRETQGWALRLNALSCLALHEVHQAGAVYPDCPSYTRHFNFRILSAANPPEGSPAKRGKALGL